MHRHVPPPSHANAPALHPSLLRAGLGTRLAVAATLSLLLWAVILGWALP